MAFDLSAVLAAAEEVVNSSSGSSYGGPKLVYPGLGDLSVRILYNPKSQSVMRLVSRHKVNGKNLICASTYHQDCPLCIGVQSYKDLTGSDMWTMDSKRIGLVLAQFIGVSKGYDNGGYTLPEKGELICLMLPWSAYKSLSEVIQRAGEHADELLTSHKGRVVIFSKKQGSNIMEYNVTIDAFAQPYLSTPTQEEFDEVLMELPDLNEVYCPSAMPEDLLGKLQAEADSLLAKVNPQVATVQTSVASVVPPISQVQQTASNITSAVPQQAEIVSNNELLPSDVNEPNKESCFGNFQSKVRTCLMCDRAVECAKETKAKATVVK